MTEDTEIQISLICPTIKSASICFKTIETLKTNLKMELIFVGPNNTFGDISKLPIPSSFISTKVKPVQCWQIGMHHAKGETVGLMADDQYFSPYAWDEVYGIYRESNDYKTIVSMNWWEHGQNYKHLINRFGIQLPSGCSVMNRDFFWELGGYDSNFARRTAEQDLFLRAIVNGATVKYCDEKFGVREEDLGASQFVFLKDAEFYESKWSMENGKIVQKIATNLFEYNDSIYTTNQGTIDPR